MNIELRVSGAGGMTLVVKPLSKPGQGVMNLRRIVLAPLEESP